jgi:hypothetical protein
MLEPILEGHIPVEALEHDSAIVYTIDQGFRLAYCNQAWDDFALQNGGAHLVREKQVGLPVLGHFSGPLRRFYRDIFARVFADRQPWEHSYECSSAEVYRRFQMRILPLRTPASLLVVNSLEVEMAHERDACEPSPDLYRTAEGLVVMCSHCRRTRRNSGPETWDWVPAYVAAPPAQTSHGICHICLNYYYPFLRSAELTSAR